jgi:nitroreductase
MDSMEVIATRRAVREYTETHIESAAIERLINAAILAPSAMNLQPWAFATLLDRGRIDRYADRAKSWLVANLSQASFPPAIRQMLEDPTLTLFYHAPALVLVMAKSSEAQAKEDCCLAAENLMLAARNDGIGSCWIGLARPWLNLSPTKLELGLPDNYHVVAPIVLGYPKSWPESHGRNPAEIYSIK